MLLRTCSYLFAAVVWAACSLELLLILVRSLRGAVKDEPLVGALLTQSEFADRFAPIVILLLLGWILFELGVHGLRLAKEMLATRQFATAVGGASEGVQPSRFQPLAGTGRAGRRAQLVLDHADSPPALREALPGAAAMDSGEVENAFAFLRVYVWILPVIGFVGTAWGMSHAIGGFSDALGQTQDVATLTARLGQKVIPGLANAFSTTIVALIAAVVGHFCSSVAQGFDQRLLDELDQASLNLAVRVPGGVVHGPRGGVVPPGEPIDYNKILASITGLSAAVERLQSQLANEAGIQAMSQAAQELRQAAHELQSSVRLPYHITVTRGETAGGAAG